MRTIRPCLPEHRPSSHWPGALRRARQALGRSARCSVAALGAWLLLCAPAAASPEPVAADNAAATIVHLLDYVGVDYPATVGDGRVVDADEYAEQREFAGQAIALLQTLPDVPARAMLLEKLHRLQALIDAKAAGTEVSALAQALRWDVVRGYGIAVAPRRAPPMAAAAALYAAHCAACHGQGGRGDGPLAKGMQPAPADFHDGQRMRARSAWGLYNTLTLGVTGTPMRAFAELSQDERWALALWVSTMRFTPEQLQAGQAAWREGEGRAAFASLQDLVTQTPAEALHRHGAAAEAMQAWLGTHPEAVQAGAAQASVALQTTGDKLDESLRRYRAGQHEAARQLAIAAYLDGFELVENSLDNVDAALRQQIEREMMALRAIIGNGQPVAAVDEQVTRIHALLQRAGDALASTGLSTATAFASSLLILLREGLEAVLVLAAILAFVRKTGRRDALAYVHIGWVAALALGALTWWVAHSLIGISGASRELTEGVTALIAALILLYVGYWLHSKSYAQAWQHFIREHVGTALLSKGTLWAMAVVSFLAVYRELFEVILFYEALWAQVGPPGRAAVLSGMGAAALLLGALTWAILAFSVRVPLGRFFAATSALLALLAVVFAGNGVAALQEAGVLTAEPIDFVSIPLLGVHPTRQGLLAQGAAIGCVLLGLWLARRRAQRVA